MANKKLLARLDIKNDDVIKGLQLEGLRRIGSIFEVAQEREAGLLDEIIVIDAVASLYGRQAVVEAIRSATAETFIPITAAGGVKCLDDAAQLFSAGADRVAVNSGAIKRPKVLEEIARRFGAQSVVLSVEAKDSVTHGTASIMVAAKTLVARCAIGLPKSTQDLLERCS